MEPDHENQKREGWRGDPKNGSQTSQEFHRPSGIFMLETEEGLTEQRKHPERKTKVRGVRNNQRHDTQPGGGNTCPPKPLLVARGRIRDLPRGAVGKNTTQKG